MTSRVRCSCGRVYDPAKHTKCPECGAESAVESVVVAEKVKPPVPPALDREAGRGDAQFAKPGKTLPWQIYAGAAVVLLLGLFWLGTRTKTHDHSVQPKPEVAQVSPQPSAQPSPAPTKPEDSKPWQANNDVSPTPEPSAIPSVAPPAAFEDPRLVGTWETKGPWPPNSGRVQTVHWTIETDGHFSFSGPWTDAGALTAADGKIRWFSNNATQPVDLTYQFNGELLATHGPLGDAYWWRTKRTSQQSRRSTQRERSRRNTVPDDAVKREILRRMFNHFPR
ncbi:MAG TPA: hypothetical protein VFQ83_05920 [Candidatus Udaeobacter sp.]|nr:hypothetical protein [Candidatus Udaeobacter sp.]